MVFPTSWPPSTFTDFVPGTAPANQALSSGTTSTTIDFPPPTGDTVSGTPTVTLNKPTGSTASASIALNSGNWRVTLSGMADLEAYGVEVEFIGSGGQKAHQSCLVSVSGTLTSDWTLVKYLDLTSATAQSGLGTDGTYTVVVGADSIPMSVTHTNALDPTTTASLTPGSGLVCSCVAGSAVAWNKLWSFKISDLVGDLKGDSNFIRIEALIEVTTLNGTSDLISFEIGDGLPVTAAYPMFGTALIKNGANDWRCRVTRRNAASATSTLGGTISTTQPTAFHPEVYCWGMWAQGRAALDSTWATSAWSLSTFAASMGQDAIAGAAFAPSYWGSTQYICLMLAGSTVGTVACTLKGFKVYVASKRRT